MFKKSLSILPLISIVVCGQGFASKQPLQDEPGFSIYHLPEDQQLQLVQNMEAIQQPQEDLTEEEQLTIFALMEEEEQKRKQLAEEKLALLQAPANNIAQNNLTPVEIEAIERDLIEIAKAAEAAFTEEEQYEILQAMEAEEAKPAPAAVPATPKPHVPSNHSIIAQQDRAYINAEINDERLAMIRPLLIANKDNCAIAAAEVEKLKAKLADEEAYQEALESELTNLQGRLNAIGGANKLIEAKIAESSKNLESAVLCVINRRQALKSAEDQHRFFLNEILTLEEALKGI